MSGVTHTPGPWHWLDDHLLKPVQDVAASGHRVTTILTFDGCMALICENGPEVKAMEAEIAANRALIAAAPKLADLLLQALPYVEEGEEFNHPNRRTVSKAIRGALVDAGIVLAKEVA